MALIEIKRDPSARDIRQFSFIWLPLFCFLLAVWAIYRYDAPRVAAALLAGGGVSIALGAVRPGWMRTVFLAWMWAAFPIGWLVSHVLIAVIYFLMITPIGLIMRALGHDPMTRSLTRPPVPIGPSVRRTATRRVIFDSSDGSR